MLDEFLMRIDICFLADENIINVKAMFAKIFYYIDDRKNILKFSWTILFQWK